VINAFPLLFRFSSAILEKWRNARFEIASPPWSNVDLKRALVDDLSAAHGSVCTGFAPDFRFLKSQTKRGRLAG
jgi:RNase P/RNase MRP subunit POP5